MTPKKATEEEVAKGFVTPPARHQEQLSAPGAPRKSKPRSPVLVPAEEELCPGTTRRLDFGQLLPESVVPAEDVDWDSFLLHSGRRGSRTDLSGAVRLIIGAGLESRGHCTVSELKRVLSAEFGERETERTIARLRMHSGWINIEGTRVTFPGLVAAATVVNILN